MLSPMAQQNVSSAVHERWQVHPDARLRIRYWGEECVLYHGAAGNTHRLPEPVGQMLEALQTGPATVAELSERIDLHLADVEDSLQEMRRLGIVECVR